MKKLLIIFAVLCLAAPAMAADWNFYGSARMATFYSIVDKDIKVTTTPLTAPIGLSRATAVSAPNVKVNDQIGGAFEMSDGFGETSENCSVPTPSAVAASCCLARPTPRSALCFTPTASSAVTATCWASASSMTAGKP